ncbi:MAG TPA: hypothetical protein H9962_07410 [Candidatus Mailhella merdigallinarum]|uniref:Uncharacterized protein n=1 Tax=Candidatus Mailhella merdigallinarum TaxID=2838658 RepID=A0A9D2HD95_9BACT|nr:hypothetical protein [Candidatus Mailhella merdigallinarum]
MSMNIFLGIVFAVGLVGVLLPLVIGLDTGHMDADLSDLGGGDAGAGSDHSGDATRDTGFTLLKLFTVQNVSSFLMGYAVFAFAALRIFPSVTFLPAIMSPDLFALFWGVVGGIFMLWLIKKIYGMARLISATVESGPKPRPRPGDGATATTSIAGDGSTWGEIEWNFRGTALRWAAVSEENCAPGEAVRVVADLGTHIKVERVHRG